MPRRSIEHSTTGVANVIDMKTGERAEVPAIPVICANVRHYRLQLGLEQKQLAALIGVSKNAVGNWECGRTRPDINLIPAICRAFRISPSTLLGIEESAPEYSAEEQTLLGKYRGLTPGHQYAVRSLVDSLEKVQAAERRRPQLYTLPYYEKPLAAGIGDPTEFEGKAHTMYFYDTPELRRANCIYCVSGDSMEPDFHDDDLVFVERIPNGPAIQPGEIGAFMLANELFIKQYETDGLHSLNPKYPVMSFDSSDTNVYLLGRILGIVKPECIASKADIADYQINHTDESI